MISIPAYVLEEVQKEKKKREKDRQPLQLPLPFDDYEPLPSGSQTSQPVRIEL